LPQKPIPQTVSIQNQQGCPRWAAPVLRFDRKSARNRRTLYYGCYTLLFLLLCAVVYGWHFRAGRSLIWQPDGYLQHFPSLVYLGEYLRGIARDFLATGRLAIPMWDFSIGFGSDILTTLHYYVLGDPLNLLSVFVPAEHTEILYQALIFARLFLSGVSFSMYCRKLGHGRFATLCGALIYVFCGYALISAARHPYFITPMVCFPWLLLGAEKIFRKERAFVFIGVVFLAAVSNFYFFYMMCLLLLLYLAIRFFTLYKTQRLRQFFRCLLRFGWPFAVGISLAAFLLWPNLRAMLSTNRVQVDLGWTQWIPLYGPQYYIQMLTAFFSVQTPGAWSYLGFSAFSFTGIVLLFAHRRKRTDLKVGLLLLTGFLLTPLMGRVFNGFSYPANRWIWGYALLVACIFVEMLPALLRVTRRQLRGAGICAAVILGLALPFRNARTRYALVPFALFVLGLLWLFLLQRRRKNGKAARPLRVRAVILGFLCMGIVLNAAFQNSAAHFNYPAEFVPAGTAYSSLTERLDQSVGKLTDEEFYRCETNPHGSAPLPYNAAMLLGLHSTSYYFSLSNPNISQFWQELNINISSDYEYNGFDGRVVPDMLQATKYQLTQGNRQGYMPLGYSETLLTEPESGYLLLKKEEKYALPFGYAYDSCLARTEYEKLSAVDKEQALLQCAVLDEPTSALPAQQPQSAAQALTFETRYTEGASYESGKFIITQAGAKVHLTFSEPRNSITYLSFRSLRLNQPSPLDVLKAKTPQALRSQLQALLQGRVAATKITVQSESIQKDLHLRMPSHTWYLGQHDFLVNLCYSKAARNEITLTFAAAGEYLFDDLQVICQDPTPLAQQADARKTDTLENVAFSANQISGSIQLDESKLLCLSMPYNGGWTATVDGQPAQVLRVNTMYTGLLLPPGEHSIQLRYVTPGLKTGLAASAAGAAALLAYAAGATTLHLRKRRILLTAAEAEL